MDWNLPKLTSKFTDVLNLLKQRTVDLATMFSESNSTNLPNGTIRWNKINKRFEILNGSTWKQLTDTYNIDVAASSNSLKLDNQSASYYVSKSDIINTLDSQDTQKPLSAKQGKALKTIVDNINTLLSSDDTTLDELQEIVNFIKQNKSSLDKLGITNIAGLKEALSNKANLAGSATQAFNVAKATSDNEAVNLAQLNTKILNVGSIIIVPVNNIPNGYLECNGATISRSAYSNLYEFLGTLYGSGNGSTTFKLPDLRGEFIRGYDHGRGVDSGRNIGSYQQDQSNGIYRATFHMQQGGNTDIRITNGNSGQIRTAGHQYDWRYWSSIRLYKNADEVRPRNVAMMYCIKY